LTGDSVEASCGQLAAHSNQLRGIDMKRIIPANTTVFISDFSKPVQRLICRRYRARNPFLKIADAELREFLDAVDLGSAFDLDD
jgi:hypothetical protein